MSPSTSGIFLQLPKNIYPNGLQLSEKAKEIAVKLKKEGFSASDGWVDKWKKVYNIKSKVIVDDSGDVNSETVAAWKGCMSPQLAVKRRTSTIWVKQDAFGRPFLTMVLGNVARSARMDNNQSKVLP